MGEFARRDGNRPFGPVGQAPSDPPSRSFFLQTQGSLQEANLASLLQSMQAERATGTLTIENDSAHCALFFLFGHLFHASDASRQGEDVVIDALGWTDGHFQFDPRAKLPAEETIKSSPSDLVAEAERRAPAAAADGHDAAVDAGAAGHENQAQGSWEDTAAPAEVSPESAAPAASAWADAAPNDTDATTETPAWQPATTEPESAASDYPSWDSPAATPEAAEEHAYDPDTAAADADPAPAYAAATGSAWGSASPKAEEPAGSSWGTSTTPEPAPEPVGAVSPIPAAPSSDLPSWATPAPAVTAAAAVAPPLAMYPLPAGKTTYEGLKATFVDFPKLLRTLRSDNHTGYVRLTGDGFSGTLVFDGGQLIEGLSDAGGSIALGEDAFQQFRQHMDIGSGHLDVVDLGEDIVAALGQLFAGSQRFQGLLGRFVNFDALIEYLGEEKMTGSVVVMDSSEIGVVLLHEGKVLGAYTESNAQLDAKLTAISTLAKELTSRIEVRSGDPTGVSIDIDAQLSKPLGDCRVELAATRRARPPVGRAARCALADRLLRITAPDRFDRTKPWLDLGGCRSTGHRGLRPGGKTRIRARTLPCQPGTAQL